MASEEFKLIGAREILNLVPGAVHIENQVAALERAVTEDPAMAVDLAKALIETVCKTILNDRGVPIGAGWDCPQLARETALKLKLVPDSHIHIREVNDSLRRVVAGLVAVVQNLCELRNAQGMASHGKDAFAASLHPAVTTAASPPQRKVTSSRLSFA